MALIFRKTHLKTKQVLRVRKKIEGSGLGGGFALRKERKRGILPMGLLCKPAVWHLPSCLENQSTVTPWELRQKDQGTTYGGTGECGLAVLSFMYDNFTEPGTELSSCTPLTLTNIAAFNTVEGLLRKTSGFLHHRLWHWRDQVMQSLLHGPGEPAAWRGESTH